MTNNMTTINEKRKDNNQLQFTLVNLLSIKNRKPVLNKNIKYIVR